MIEHGREHLADLTDSERRFSPEAFARGQEFKRRLQKAYTAVQSLQELGVLSDHELNFSWDLIRMWLVPTRRRPVRVTPHIRGEEMPTEPSFETRKPIEIESFQIFSETPDGAVVLSAESPSNYYGGDYLGFVFTPRERKIAIENRSTPQ